MHEHKHKRTTETEEEKLILPARPSSLEGAAEVGAGRRGDLSVAQIREWVEVYRGANEGRFPSSLSGEILSADGSPTGETWGGLDSLFRIAQRGRPARGLQNSGFTSLSDFLDKSYPGERVEKQDFSIEQIRGWVDAHRATNDGKFPSSLSGKILNADGSETGENWSGLQSLFRTAQKGSPARGLGGLSFKSLRDFLDKEYPGERKVRIEKADLSIDQIKGWVDAHRAANDGKFPSLSSGEVLNADRSPTGETWKKLDALFRTVQKGRPARGLQNSGFTSLSDFLDKSYPDEREIREKKQDPSIEQIREWVDVHRAANAGKFPSVKSGEVLNADGSPTGETWKGLDELFRKAQKGRPARGLQHSGFTSLSDFLDKTYPTERAREHPAPTARREVDDINVLLDLLE